MDHLEMTEKLREKTGVSYEDAKEALERHEWDMLEAIIDLEAQGKIDKPKDEHTAERAYKRPADQPATQAFEKAGSVVSSLVEKGNSNWLEVTRDDRLLFKVPLTIAILIAFFCFWIVFPGMAVGYLFGWRYRYTSAATKAENTASAH